MKKLISLFILVQFLSCSQVEKNIDLSSLKIKVINQHSFLTDHDRLLIVQNENDIIDKFELYSDAGSGCETYVFENDSAFTLIDCNGQWFSVDKVSGQIEALDWAWQKQLPENRKGAFVFDKSLNEYKLIDTVGKIYKYKDPKEY